MLTLETAHRFPSKDALVHRFGKGLRFCTRLSLAALAVGTVFVAPAPPAAAAGTCAGSMPDFVLDGEETAMLNGINKYRQQNGLISPLKFSPTLRAAAPWMSRDMANRDVAVTGTLSHTDSLGRIPSVRMADCGYSGAPTPGPGPENIAAGLGPDGLCGPLADGTSSTLGFGSCGDAAHILNGWKHSPLHNAALLNPGFVVAGIGRAQSASGWWYWTLDMGGSMDPPKPASLAVFGKCTSPGLLMSLTGIWSCPGSPTPQWLVGSGIPVSSSQSLSYGADQDIPMCGSWMGTRGLGVYRPPYAQFNPTGAGQWLLRNSISAGSPDIPQFAYGGMFAIDGFDIPVFGDWSGTGAPGVGVYRNGQWLLRNSMTPGDFEVQFSYGSAGDIPVVGDWTGTGKASVGYYRPANSPLNQSTAGQWFLSTSIPPGGPEIKFSYGGPGDLPVVGDWTGAGRTSIGVYRPAGTTFNQTGSGKWLLRKSPSAGPPEIPNQDGFVFGGADNVPVVCS